MMIMPDVALCGTLVDLLPMEKKHFKHLEILSKDKRIWKYYIFDGSDPEKFLEAMNLALVSKDKGTEFPFVIIDKMNNQIIGSTRFLDIQPVHKKLEIGWTWIHPDCWGSSINTECKLLLLEYCFEKLGTVRVQFKTDENNVRSRRAIEKIGGKFEGILRNDMLREDNSKRNSAYYSITDYEWILVKAGLLDKLQ